MDNWWKDPRFDDEGTYDYLVEELPKDHAGWEFNRYGSKCDTCGKERLLLLRATHYFYCWDGWDSMDYADCWVCRLKTRVSSIKHRIKKQIKKQIETIEMTLELHRISPKWSWKKSYECARKIGRRKEI